MSPLVTAYLLKEEMRECGAIACRHFEWTSLQVHVTYDLNDTRAGVARCASSHVRFNLTMLMQQSPEDIRQIAAHELAHIVVWRHWYENQRWPEEPPDDHGDEWVFVMTELFGRPAEVYHNFLRRSTNGLPRAA